MLAQIEMWGYYLLCGILCIVYILSIRRRNMSNFAQNVICASASVLYLCAYFTDRAQSVTDQLTLLVMALFMTFLAFQAWRSCPRAAPTTNASTGTGEFTVHNT